MLEISIEHPLAIAIIVIQAEDINCLVIVTRLMARNIHCILVPYSVPIMNNYAKLGTFRSQIFHLSHLLY